MYSFFLCKDFTMGVLELFDISTESVSPDGAQKTECEYEIYGTMRDMSVLASAVRSELQEQWGVPIEKVETNAASGSLRVRLTSNTDAVYTFTSKVKRESGNDEIEISVTEDLFKHFKLFAKQGMQKRRYFFPVEGTDFVYEVDVFFNPDGSPNPRIKIDLEIQGSEGIDSLPTLPFELDNITVIPPGRKSVEHLAFVRELYDKHYTMPNQFIEPPVQVVEETSMESDGSESVMVRLKQLATDGASIRDSLSDNGSELEACVKQHLLELSNMVTRLYAEENRP
jgi:CYTH domain-containing protein